MSFVLSSVYVCQNLTISYFLQSIGPERIFESKFNLSVPK
eukprot:UN13698